MAAIWGLIVYLSKLGVCMAAFYILFSLRLPFPSFEFGVHGSKIMAGIAGLFLWCGVFYYHRKAKSLLAEQKMIMARGPFRNGQQIAVSGIIEAEGPLLTAPLSGRECLGYRYKSSRVSRSVGSPGTGGRGVEIKDYEGYGLTSSVINSNHGNMKILAKPDGQFFGALPVNDVGTSKENRQRAEAYFETADYGKLKGMKQAYHREIVEGPGIFRYDAKPATPPKESYSLYEVLLTADQKITLAGVYSAAQNGIEPDPDWITRPFIAKPGEPANLEKDIRSNRFKTKIYLAISGITVVIFYLIVLFYGYDVFR